MARATVTSFELLERLIPVASLDEEGLALYGSLRASEDEHTVRTGIVQLLERLCDLGHVRRLSRTETDGAVRLRYRDLRTLDTISINCPLPPTSPAEPAPIRVEPTAPASTAAIGSPFLRAMAASSRRTDLAGALEYLYDLLRETIGCDRAVVIISEGLANSEAGTLLEFEDIHRRSAKRRMTTESMRRSVEETGKTLQVPDLAADPRFAHRGSAGATGSVTVAPLKAEAYVYGVLEVWSADPDAHDSDATTLIELIAEFVGGLIKRRLEIEELIFVDRTCRIHNRHYFDEQLSREIERSKRSGSAMALLMIDLDDFKQVNDTLGHAAGDSVLRQVAHVLSENARQVDIVARHGGEEFAVILPNVSRESALAVAERMRGAVDAHAFITGSGDHPTWDMTISVGGALYPVDADSRADLIDKADRVALYDAKHRGKNRVVFWKDTQ